MAISNEPIIVAIELGSSRISGIAGKKRDGSMQILAYAEDQTTACIKRGLVYNIEKTTQSIKKVIGTLSQIINQKVMRVYVGVGGQSVRSVRRNVHRNMLTQTSITKAIIDELQKESEEMEIVGYEMLENVPQGFVVDKAPTADPVGVFGTYVEGDFLNIIARTQLRGNIQTCFNSVGVNIESTKITAFELAKNVLTEQEKRAGCALIDLGAGTTTVVIYLQNLVRFITTIPIGFSNIIDDLKSVLQIEDKEAADLLMEYGNAFIDSEDDTTEILNTKYTTSNNISHKLVKIHQIIEARLTEIVANAVEQIANSGFEDNLLAGVVITGGGSNMKNIDKAFENNSRKIKFQGVRIAKSIVTPIIKTTGAQNLVVDNAMTCSLLSLLLSGEKNCVGEDEYKGDDIFAQHVEQQHIEKSANEELQRKKNLNDLLEKLEKYNDRMRSHINRLNNQLQKIQEDGKNKKERETGQIYADEAKQICDGDFYSLISALEEDLKGDQRITTAKTLADQLKDKIAEIEETILREKDNNSMKNRFIKWLRDTVNGE